MIGRAGCIFRNGSNHICSAVVMAAFSSGSFSRNPSGQSAAMRYPIFHCGLSTLWINRSCFTPCQCLKDMKPCAVGAIPRNRYPISVRIRRIPTFFIGINFLCLNSKAFRVPIIFFFVSTLQHDRWLLFHAWVSPFIFRCYHKSLRYKCCLYNLALRYPTQHTATFMFNAHD